MKNSPRTLLAAIAVASATAGGLCAAFLPEGTTQAVPCDLETSTSGAQVTYGAGAPGCKPETVSYGDTAVPPLPDLATASWPPAETHGVQCTEEDGSGPQVLPCYWGDGTMGVKGGLSYLVTQGQYGRDSRCFLYRDPAVRAEYNGCE